MSNADYKPFSVRNDYEKPKLAQHESMDEDLRNRLWNVLCEYFPNRSILELASDFDSNNPFHYFFKVVWSEFLKLPIDQYEKESLSKSASKDFFRNIFATLEWYKIFDLIEFVISHPEVEPNRKSVIILYNRILKEENSAYKIVSGLVVPITSKQEIESIEIAMETPYDGANNHIKKSLNLFSQRENPDYENSIKESISAVESIAKEIIGKEKSLTALTQKLKLHPNLKNGLDEIYNWTSKTARHGKSSKGDKPLNINQNTARFMLITCSAFVNYIVAEDPKNSKNL